MSPINFSTHPRNPSLFPSLSSSSPTSHHTPRPHFVFLSIEALVATDTLYLCISSSNAPVVEKMAGAALWGGTMDLTVHNSRGEQRREGTGRELGGAAEMPTSTRNDAVEKT